MGVFHCVEAFLPGTRRPEGSGHVVATASVVGLTPADLPYHTPYTASKAGVIGLMLNLRQELSESGIGCTVLCPGGVQTRIHRSPRYRPARFGGPEPRNVTLPDGYRPAEKLAFRPAEEVAEMLLEAVRENRPLVVTDPSQRERFLEGYVDVVLAAFDALERFDRGAD